MNIMICHDGSQRAQTALDKALNLFRPLKPKIMLLTVVEAPLDASSTNEVSFKKFLEKREEEIKAAGSCVVDKGFETDVIVAVGDPGG